MKTCIAKIKKEYAFQLSSRYHYGEVIGYNTDSFGNDEINLKCDLRYNHDSIVWIPKKFYDIFQIGDNDE